MKREEEYSLLSFSYIFFNLHKILPLAKLNQKPCDQVAWDTAWMKEQQSPMVWQRRKQGKGEEGTYRQLGQRLALLVKSWDGEPPFNKSEQRKMQKDWWKTWWAINEELCFDKVSQRGCHPHFVIPDFCLFPHSSHPIWKQAFSVYSSTCLPPNYIHHLCWYHYLLLTFSQ